MRQRSQAEERGSADQDGKMHRLLQGLNEEQRQAVQTTEGPLLVLAGAGSGKTRVLTHRVAYLMEVKKILPWNILAVTFTNKAAREMRERVGQLVGPMAEEMWIGTFHSVCVRILRRESHHLGYAPAFSILDPQDQLAVVKQVLRELNLDPNRFEPRSLLAAISHAKNELLTAERYEAQAGNLFQKTVSRVYQLYQRRLAANQAMDFDDLILLTVRLFQENPEVLEAYQRRFQYIHIDEYQDTNRAQYLLVRMLAERHQNICVVGDADQSIYRWRGADMGNILNFQEDYPQATVIKLEQNYRSTQHILDAANHVIANNRQRQEKRLWTANPKGELIHRLIAEDEHQEASFIVEEIRRQVGAGRKYGDFAILYRTNAQSRVLEETLTREGLPYRMVGGMRFYERMEIKDLIAYLRLVVNPEDEWSLERVINVPKRGIGATSLERLKSYAAERQVSLYEALKESERAGLSGKAARAAAQFAALIAELRQMSEYLSASEMIEEVLARSGYRESLAQQNTIEAEGRLENIQEFISVAVEFEARNETRTLLDFLTELSLMTDLDTLEEQDVQDAVVLMTLHSAKGLEFPVVFLCGMEEGIFPHKRALDDEEELEEERRLAYVGITRAEERLYLTAARRRMIYGQVMHHLPSRFFAEIPAHLQYDRSDDANARTKEEASARFRSRGSSGVSARQAGQSGVAEYWRAGEKVIHHKWGQGIVVSVHGEGEDTELTVVFGEPVGMKRLMARYAPLQKVKSEDAVRER
jgi:DNA helicase-2/ATP-dependent DNA helicase PcrA